MSLPTPQLSFAYDANGERKFIGGRAVYSLIKDVEYERKGFAKLVIEAGFESDLSSVPRWLSWFIAHDDLGFAEAGIIHDWLYRRGPYTRPQADLLFRELLREWGVDWFKAWAAYLALRAFGKRNYTTTRLTLFAVCLVFLLASAAQAEIILVTVTGDNCPYCRAHARAMTDAGVREELRTAKALTISLHESTLAQSQVDGTREVPIGVNGRVVKVEPFRVRGWPIVMVVDAQGDQGKVLRRFDGAMPVDELRAFIRGGAK